MIDCMFCQGSKPESRLRWGAREGFCCARFATRCSRRTTLSRSLDRIPARRLRAGSQNPRPSRSPLPIRSPTELSSRRISLSRTPAPSAPRADRRLPSYDPREAMNNGSSPPRTASGRSSPGSRASTTCRPSSRTRSPGSASWRPPGISSDDASAGQRSGYPRYPFADLRS